MFGIFYALFAGAMSVGNKVTNDCADSSARARARNANDDTYYSKDGLRLVSNGRLVHKTRIMYSDGTFGDEVLKDMYNGKIYRNYTAEQREKENAELDAKGATVERVDYYKLNETQQKILKQTPLGQCSTFNLTRDTLYQDRKTRRYYIERPINQVRFYLDIETGMMVRVSDDEKLNRKIYKYTTDEIIKMHNKKQEELRTDPRFIKDWGWTQRYYYGINCNLFIKDDGEFEYQMKRGMW